MYHVQQAVWEYLEDNEKQIDDVLRARQTLAAEQTALDAMRQVTVDAQGTIVEHASDPLIIHATISEGLRVEAHALEAEAARLHQEVRDHPAVSKLLQARQQRITVQTQMDQALAAKLYVETELAVREETLHAARRSELLNHSEALCSAEGEFHRAAGVLTERVAALDEELTAIAKQVDSAVRFEHCCEYEAGVRLLQGRSSSCSVLDGTDAHCTPAPGGNDFTSRRLRHCVINKPKALQAGDNLNYYPATI